MDLDEATFFVLEVAFFFAILAFPLDFFTVDFCDFTLLDALAFVTFLLLEAICAERRTCSVCPARIRLPRSQFIALSWDSLSP